MKAQGYKAKLIWEKPLEAGWMRTAAPVIQESSLSIATNNPVIGEVLDGLQGFFIVDCEKRGIPGEAWKPIYSDLQTLLKPLAGE
jgi:hypothetical protein